MGMPWYGGCNLHAARSFFGLASKGGYERHMDDVNSSLLADGFNQLWCSALNSRNQGITHFAMQHADLDPDKYWLDTLLAEMEKKGVDIISVVVPIKDQRGLTSTAIGWANDPWSVARRLTLYETQFLPQTFTTEDVVSQFPDIVPPGGRLLMNTGLWVCKLGDWSERCHFEICNRIVKIDGKFYRQVIPEDWNFSRMAYEAGAKIACTSAVKVTHYGNGGYTTRGDVYGEKFDKEIVDKHAERMGLFSRLVVMGGRGLSHPAGGEQNSLGDRELSWQIDDSNGFICEEGVRAGLAQGGQGDRTAEQLEGVPS